MKDEDKEVVRRIWREEEAKRRRKQEELRRRGLDKSGRPASGLVDTDETVYED